MKQILNIKVLTLFVALLSIFGCKKKMEDRSILNADAGAGTFTINLSKQDIDVSTPTDTALVLTWESPDYGFDAKVGYQLQAATKEANLGSNSSIAKTWDLPADENALYLDHQTAFAFLQAAGIAPNDSVDVYFRIKSYIFNSPDKLPLNSKVVKVNLKRLGVVTPVNNELFLVGDADSTNAWNNPVLVPNNSLVKINDYEYGGTFYLIGGKEYLLLPENGSWDSKYCLNDGDKATPGIENGGKFVFKTAGGDNFLAPTTSGWYKIHLNFATGMFTVSPETNAIPQSLWAVGEATPEGWNNAPADAQKCERVNCNVYTYTQNFDADKMLKFLSINGSWQPQFGKGSDIGILGFNYGSGSDPDVIMTPSTAGVHTITIDFYNFTYKFD